MSYHVGRKRRNSSLGSFTAVIFASSAAAALGEPSTASSTAARPVPLTSAAEMARLRATGGEHIADAERAGTNGSSSRWGLGISVTYPIASIYMVQFSYSAWRMGDVLTGYAYQHWNDKGQSHAHTLLLGYRQFIWRGLHAEVELWPAYNPFKSSIDGKTYKGLELWCSARVGYRIDFEVFGREFFVLPQPSIGFGVARQKKWPEQSTEFRPIFEPQLIVGARF